MNVLHMALSFERGGRRRAIETLTERLRHLGVRCDLACLDSLGCESRHVSDLFGDIDVLSRRSAYDGVALRRLAAFCHQRDIDIVHAHDAASQFTAVLSLVWQRKPKLLMTFHRSIGIESARLRDRLRNAFACWRSDAIITGSRERQDHFRRENHVNRRKVIRIPFGIDTARFRSMPEARADVRGQLGLSEDTFLIGAVGHFGSEKGIDVVVKAFHELVTRPSAARAVLVVVGDGTPDQKAEIEFLATSIPPGRIFFPGFRPDVERWFQAFDLFVHGPRLEAFGLVVAEAMATRVPVVATRVGGVPDMVRPGKTGILVPPESPVEMADAIDLLIQDHSLRSTLADNAAQVAQQEYGADLFAQRHLRLYEDVLAGRMPRGINDETEDWADGGSQQMIPHAGGALNGNTHVLRGGQPCPNK